MVELCITCKSTTTVTIYIHLLKIRLCRTGIATHLPVLLEVLGSVVRKHPSIDVLPVMRFLTTPSSAPQVNFEYATTTCKSKACNKWHARITECGRYRYSSNTNLAYGLMTRQDGLEVWSIVFWAWDLYRTCRSFSGSLSHWQSTKISPFWRNTRFRNQADCSNFGSGAAGSSCRSCTGQSRVTILAKQRCSFVHSGMTWIKRLSFDRRVIMAMSWVGSGKKRLRWFVTSDSQPV